MRSYEAASSLFSFLAFIAWSVVVIGVIVALVGAAGASQYGGSGAGLLAMVPGIGIGITGFILVAFNQMGRATVDTAEYTQQMLEISRGQLEVSKQGLQLQGGSPVTSFAANSETNDGKLSLQGNDASYASEPAENTDQSIEKMPKEIQSEYEIQGNKLVQNTDGTFKYDSLEFVSLDGVKEHIRIQSFRGGAKIIGL